VSTVDSGLFTAASVLGGIVWTDQEANGRLDQGESAIADVKLELLDAAGQLAATTTTGPSGTYQFSGVAPGRYQVRLDPATLPGGVAFTTRDVGLTADVGSDVDEGMGTTVFIDVGRAYSNTSWDIGLTFVGIVADGAWLDDGNGIKDAGEPLVSGVAVALLDAAGATVNATVTDDAGNYRFGRVRPGSYTLAFSSFPAGSQLTAAKATTDATVDSDPDPTSGRTDPFDVHGSDEGGFHGAGLVRPLATVTGLAWVDQNDNGTFDDKEDAGVGLQVALLAGDGRLVATSVVGGSGAYAFAGVAPGTYQIAYTLPDGLQVTPAGGKASKVDPATLRSEPFELEAGATDDSWTLRAERKASPAAEAVAALQGAQHRFARANRAGRVVLAASSAALASLAILRGWRQRQKRRALR
jgi:protocatechuate 3,4-dioxygenase beta subunit